MGSPARNMSSTTGYSATPTADFSVIEISERKATDPAYYWKVSTAFLGVVAVALMFIAVAGHSTETVDATPDGNARATDLMWGMPSSAKCEGAGKLPGGGPLCYQVKVGMFGVTEAIDMRIAGARRALVPLRRQARWIWLDLASPRSNALELTSRRTVRHATPTLTNLRTVFLVESLSNLPTIAPTRTKCKSRSKTQTSLRQPSQQLHLASSVIRVRTATPKSPEMCGKAINVDVTAGDDPETWVTGKLNEMSPITIGGYYNTIGGSPDRDAYVQKYWPNRKKYFPDAHIHTWEQDSWDCKGNMQGGCNGDRDQWLTLGCEYCVAEEAKAAAGKWAIWHTVNNSNIGCGKEMDDNAACDQDTLPRHGLVKLIATYDDRHFWSPKIWTDYNHPSVTVKGTPICCHPVCATDPGCGKETGGLFTCGLVLGGCCELTGFLQCGYAGPHLDCDN